MLAKLYRRALLYASTPMFVEAIRRANSSRDDPLPSTALWSIAPRFMWNGRKVNTASSYAEHLAIASDIIGVPARTHGCVVECGCYKGGSTVNLSVAAALARRELHVFDSFQGLPTPCSEDEQNTLHHDHLTATYESGMYAGSLEEVRENVRRYGDLGVCHFHEGWFEDTLSDFEEPCVTAFVDVDLRASLETCVQAIWPLMVDGAALFVHEARHQEIAALFFDSDWWERKLGTHAPGLIGAGNGLGVGPEIGGWTSQLGYARKSQTIDYVNTRG